MGKVCRRLKRRKEIVSAPISLPRLDAATLTELRQRYEETSNVESRTRYQMILLAKPRYKVPQIAHMVLRSEDTVARVLNRFVAGGLDRAPRRTPPGRERKVTAAWEAELLHDTPVGSPRGGTGNGQLDHRIARRVLTAVFTKLGPVLVFS